MEKVDDYTYDDQDKGLVHGYWRTNLPYKIPSNDMHAYCNVSGHRLLPGTISSLPEQFGNSFSLLTIYVMAIHS